SNNFFLVFPRRPCALDLDGLCALLNSRLLTWFFQTVEPRSGRVFAELKIKHLTAFPLPRAILDAGACQGLNRLGRRRSRAAARLVPAVEDGAALGRLTTSMDREINRQVE